MLLIYVSLYLYLIAVKLPVWALDYINKKICIQNIFKTLMTNDLKYLTKHSKRFDVS